jgi:hypothetical protein
VEVSYFGAALREDTLIPANTALRGNMNLDAWLRMSLPG